MRVLALFIMAFTVVLNAGTTWHCSWAASMDNVGVTGYIVNYTDSLGNEQSEDVGDVLTWSFIGGDSTCATVQAYDAAGNVSDRSAVACAQTAQNPFDLTGDGKVTGVDVIDLRLAIRRDDPDPKYDLNNDGKLTGADLIALRLYIKNN